MTRRKSPFLAVENRRSFAILLDELLISPSPRVPTFGWGCYGSFDSPTLGAMTLTRFPSLRACAAQEGQMRVLKKSSRRAQAPSNRHVVLPDFLHLNP